MCSKIYVVPTLHIKNIVDVGLRRCMTRSTCRCMITLNYIIFLIIIDINVSVFMFCVYQFLYPCIIGGNIGVYVYRRLKGREGNLVLYRGVKIGKVKKSGVFCPCLYVVLLGRIWQ